MLKKHASPGAHIKKKGSRYNSEALPFYGEYMNYPDNHITT